jgi:hypothetical protein
VACSEGKLGTINLGLGKAWWGEGGEEDVVNVLVLQIEKQRPARAVEEVSKGESTTVRKRR